MLSVEVWFVRLNAPRLDGSATGAMGQRTGVGFVAGL